MFNTTELANKVLEKLSAPVDPELVIRGLANNTDDVLMAIMRNRQRAFQSERPFIQEKQAALLPEEFAKSYFFSNPYGFDFDTWMNQTQAPGQEPESYYEDEPVGEEVSEDPETNTGTETETGADYMPNATSESVEPVTTPTNSVPVSKPLAEKVKKTAAVMYSIGMEVLRQRGLLKISESVKDTIHGGLADNKPASDFSPTQLAMGRKVEHEHTNDPEKAEEIAKDHLEEFPQYYTALKAMEAHLEAQKKSASLQKQALNPYTVDRIVRAALKNKNITDVVSKYPRSLHVSMASSTPQLKGIKSRELLREISVDPRLKTSIANARKKEIAETVSHNTSQEDFKFGKHPLRWGLLGLSGAALGGAIAARLKHQNMKKKALDASALLGQDEQRKDDMHQQQLRHNEENHQIELAKGQLELQQAQETFGMKQQQQAQKNQEQMAQQQMAQQQMAQQQQQMSQSYLSNLSGGSPNPGQQPQQGYQASR